MALKSFSPNEAAIYLSRYIPTAPRDSKLLIAELVCRAGYKKLFKECVGCVILPTESLPDSVIVDMAETLKKSLEDNDRRALDSLNSLHRDGVTIITYPKPQGRPYQ